MYRTVEQIEPPADVLALAPADYADAFRVDLGAAAEPEPFARTMLDGASARTRASLLAGWAALGLRLGSPKAVDRVLGWRIVHSTPGELLLAASSPLGLEGRLVFRREPEGVLFSTLVELRTPLARTIWQPVVRPHQRIVRELLTDGARRLGETSARGVAAV